MRGKRLAERRAKLRALAARDAANRCAYCKRNLFEVGLRFEDFLEPGVFCSEACLLAAREQRQGSGGRS